MLTHPLRGFERRRRGDDPRARPRGIRELFVLLAGAVTYFGVRVIVEGPRDTAIRNAQRLLDVEEALGIDIESGVQTHVVDNEVLRTIGNLSYVWLHWPLLLAVLFVLWRNDQRLYRRLRNALFASGAAGLVLFTLVPMAPPRFMPGFVGTVSDDARRHFISYPLSWTNQFAAFPSFHAGWTLVACLALAAAVSTRGMKALALVPAALVIASVVTTGNHYVIDTAVGIIIALTAYWFAARRPSTDLKRSNAPVSPASTERHGGRSDHGLSRAA